MALHWEEPEEAPVVIAPALESAGTSLHRDELVFVAPSWVGDEAVMGRSSSHSKKVEVASVH